MRGIDEHSIGGADVRILAQVRIGVGDHVEGRDGAANREPATQSTGKRVNVAAVGSGFRWSVA